MVPAIRTHDLSLITLSLECGRVSRCECRAPSCRSSTCTRIASRLNVFFLCTCGMSSQQRSAHTFPWTTLPSSRRQPSPVRPIDSRPAEIPARSLWAAGLPPRSAEGPRRAARCHEVALGSGHLDIARLRLVDSEMVKQPLCEQ